MSWAGKISELEGFVAAGLKEIRDSVARDLARHERQLTERLNQAARRLRLAETPAEWRAVLLETAARFATRSAVFDTSNPPIARAPAIATAIETRDTVVTTPDASQLSSAIIESLGPRASQRCYLFPVLDGKNVPAVLYAENPDRNALELLASMASGSYPAPRAAQTPAAAQLVQLKGIGNTTPRPALPEKPTPHDLHARRFARTHIARILLDHPQELQAARQKNAVYSTLRESIESGRAEFQRCFLDSHPAMADHYHEELIRTLARQDASRMGHEYPGPLR